MALALGSADISRVYLGSVEVEKAYLGSAEVYARAAPVFVAYSRTGSWNWLGTAGRLYSGTVRMDIPDDGSTYGLWVDGVQQFRANHFQSGLSAADLPNSNILANPGYGASDTTFTGREFGDLNRAWYGGGVDRNRNWALLFTDVAGSTSVRWCVAGVGAEQSSTNVPGTTSGRGLADFPQIGVFGAARGSTVVEVRRVAAA